MHKQEKLKPYNFDFTIIVVMILLLLVGFYCMKQVDHYDSAVEGLLLKQLLGAGVGMFLLTILLFIDYRIICQYSWILYIGIVFLLAFTLKFGRSINNVKRWIIIGGISLQPSEFAKVILIVFLAFLCNYFHEKLNNMYTFVLLVIVVAIPVVLILKEPHLSSCIVILFVCCSLLFCSGISYKVFGIVLSLFVPLAICIVVSVSIFDVKLPFIKSYQVDRIMSFLSNDETEDLSGKYQQNQAKIAISSGGLSGKLFDVQETTRQYDGIYANESDFVFSVVGEEFGFVGSTLIIMLYVILIFKCLQIAVHAPDYMGRMICIGTSALIAFQTFVNIGVAINLLPNTGLPLPFISSGLTSLVSSIISIGLVLNVGLRRTN